MIKRIRKNLTPKDISIPRHIFSPVEGYFIFAGDAKGGHLTCPESVRVHQDKFFAIQLYVDASCNGHVLDFPLDFKSTRIERYANHKLRNFRASFDWWKQHQAAFHNNSRMLFLFDRAILEISRNPREYISFPKKKLEERYLLAHTHQNMIVTVYFNSRYITPYSELETLRFGEKLSFSSFLGTLR